MASFKILAFSASGDPVDRACTTALTRCLDQNHSVHSVTVIGDRLASGAVDQEISGADGVCFFLPVLGSASAAIAPPLTEPIAGALRRKPAALVVRHDSVRGRAVVRDFMADLAVEHQAFCFPPTVDITRADFDAELRPSRDLQERLQAMVHEFTVFATAIKLFSKATGQAPAIPAGRPDPPRVNHLNVLARDLQKSLKFYTDTLGVRYRYNLGPDKAVTDLDGFEFYIQEVADVRYPPGFHFGVRTTQKGVFELYARLQSLEIPFVKGNGPAPGAYLGADRVRAAFYFEDPDGLLIEVYSPELGMIEPWDR